MSRRAGVGSAPFKPATTPPPVFPPDATHYWRLGTTSNCPDEIGSLDIIPGVGVTVVSGPLDNASRVNNNGIGWYGQSASTPTFLPLTGGTVSLWMKCAIDNNQAFVAGQYTADSPSATAWAWQPDDDAAPSQLALKITGVAIYVSATVPEPSDGDWHNYVFRRSADGATTELWIDGTMVTSADTSTIDPDPGSKPFAIGTNFGTNPALPTDLSDIATWARPLTDEEITTLYNGGTPLRP